MVCRNPLSRTSHCIARLYRYRTITHHREILVPHACDRAPPLPSAPPIPIRWIRNTQTTGAALCCPLPMMLPYDHIAQYGMQRYIACSIKDATSTWTRRAAVPFAATAMFHDRSSFLPPECHTLSTTQHRDAPYISGPNPGFLRYPP